MVKDVRSCRGWSGWSPCLRFFLAVLFEKAAEVYGIAFCSQRISKCLVHLNGYAPFGSGAIEGACRHVTKDRMDKDRMELSGVRWTVESTQSVLRMRSIYLNGDWKQFDEYRIQTEQNTLTWKAA